MVEVTPSEAQLPLLERRLDVIEKQVSDAINGLMMLGQALQFWCNDQDFQARARDPDLEDAVDEHIRKEG